MKSRIKKIIIVATALLFVGSGVSFAHDWKDRPHKQRGHAYGHYKKGFDYRPGRYEKHFYGYRHPRYNPRHHYKKHYRHKKNYKPRYFQRHKRHSSYNVYHFSF